jgi:hypothetical protein
MSEKFARLRTRIVEHFSRRYELNRITVSIILIFLVLTALCYWFMVSTMLNNERIYFTNYDLYRTNRMLWPM